MKLAGKLSIFIIFLLAVSVFSQTDTVKSNAVAGIISDVVSSVIDTTAQISDSSITIDSLEQNAKFIAKIYKGVEAGTFTVLLLVAAIIKLLISVMKFPIVAKLLDTPKVKPLKPYIALALGILSGFIASVIAGQSLSISILAGLTAGFGSIGIHETIKSILNKNG